MKFIFRESLFKIWYWYVNRVDKKAEVVFMNYGFCNAENELTPDPKDEENQYPMQLYHHMVCETDIDNMDLVEIGSGRGGGLNYVTKKFSPSSAIGVDINKVDVAFCNKHYDLKNLSFVHGDAQNLNLKSNSCDIVLNVESSHRYPNMSSFLSEVSRILRPNGLFLFTDFRYSHEMDEMKSFLKKSGLKIMRERQINNEVLRALELDDNRRRKLVKKLTPKVLHKIALNFAGTIGSETFNHFLTRRYIYFSYILKKESYNMEV